jgi:hypothetical protein
LKCARCSREVDSNGSFCSGCGAPLSGVAELSTRPRVGPEGSPGAADLGAEHQLLPGMVLGGRYRIVMPVGHGGMGEVYRADDLKLGQAVALKFLPERVQNDPQRVARLLDEVRLARQVAHPNVARVWDAGEVDGRHFLSMEFVDGEDLGSLLRRIGRLPEDRAIRVARQLCAGLAAAHEIGILHRDLKPANIMIDGRGRVRVTDFGLAVLGDRIEGPDALAGTPAYMAPEQLAGREVTVRSDLYALGLILYELFTGEPAFEVAGEVLRRRGSTPKPPSSHVKGLSPAVEAAILRCLEPDPQARPPSALSVAAALPGGDPLAAALAAGETPSPELVAAAGGPGGLSPRVAIACLGLALAGLFGVARLAERTTLLSRVPLEKPPAVLRDRAKALLRDLGYRGAPADTDDGFDYDRDYLSYLQEHLGEIGRAPGLAGSVYYWYRQGSEEMGLRRTPWAPRSFSNPAPTASGMAGVRLDTEGRLLELLAAPGLDGSAPAATPDWSKLFEAADLDPDEFHRAEPTSVPPVYADMREAWEGASPRWPGARLRVEAGAFRARPVYFRVTGPWERRTEPPQPHEAIDLVLLALAAVLARRNHRRGRTDSRSARRLAVGFCLMVLFAVALYDGSDLAVQRIVLFQVLIILFYGVFLWTGYLAIEPFVRRHWPDALTAWTRLLSGRLRDPLVGRDVLLAVLSGLVLSLLSQAATLIQGMRGLLEVPDAQLHPLDALLGGRLTFTNVLIAVPAGVLNAMFFLLVLVILRVLLRRPWLAYLVAVPLIPVLTGARSWVDLGLYAPFVAVVLAVLVRWGVLAGALAVTVAMLTLFAPMTVHLGAWYGEAAMASTVVVLALAGYGFVTALAGRAVLSEGFFDS